jgi:uncharacterized repeat protein (TIGR01451 family)
MRTAITFTCPSSRNLKACNNRISTEECTKHMEGVVSMVKRNFGIIVAILMVLANIASTQATPLSPAEWESRHLPQRASACITSDPYEGLGGGTRDDYYQYASTIDESGQPGHTFDIYWDKDWEKFATQPGYLYTITTTNLTPVSDPNGFYADTKMELYAADGVTLLDQNDDYGGTHASRIQLMATSATTYYLKIYNFNPSIYGCDIGYDLLWSATPPKSILGISKTANDANGGNLFEGDRISYTINVINNYSTTQTHVVISDALPAFTTYVPNSASASRATLSGPNPFLADVGSLAPGETASLSFLATVNKGSAGQTIQNTAYANSDQLSAPVSAGPVSPQPNNGLVLAPQLAITKTAQDVNGGLLFGGDEVTYWITVTNLLTTPQTGIVITDSYESGSAAIDVGLTSGPNPLVGLVGTLPGNASATLTFRVKVNANAAGKTISNTASTASDMQTTPLTAGPVMPQPGGGVVQPPRLRVNKTAEDVNGGMLYTGDVIRYQVAVMNLLSTTQTNVVITDVIPTHTSYISESASTSQGTISAHSPLQADIGSLGAGQAATLTFQVRVDEGTAGVTITNTGQAGSDQQPSPVLSDPVAPRPSGGLVHAGHQALAIAKQAVDLNGNYVVEDDEIAFTIIVTNLLDTTQTGIVITDAIPAYSTLTPGSLISSTGMHVDGPSPFVAKLDLLSPGASALLGFRVTVNPGTAGGLLTNTATASSNQQQQPVIAGPEEPQPYGGRIQLHQLSLSKSAIDLNGGPLYEGDRIAYTIVVTNHLQVQQSGITIVDTPPDGTTYVPGSVQVSQGSVDDRGPLTATIGTLPAGASGTFTFCVTVNSGTAGQTISNTAFMFSDQQDTLVSAGPVEPQPGGGWVHAGRQRLGIHKTGTTLGTPYEFLQHGLVEYTLVAQNLLTTTQSNVVISDALPTGANYVLGTANLSQGYVLGTHTLQAYVGTLQPGQSVTFTFRAQVYATQERTVTNVARASSDEQTPEVFSLPIRTLAPYHVYLPIIVNEP